MKGDKSQDAVEQRAKFVAEQLDAGIPKDEVKRRLSDSGLRPFEAQQLVEDVARRSHEASAESPRYQAPVESLRREVHRESGLKDLGYGFLLLLVGGVVTLVTWALAEPGGSYWVMWGAMIFGGFYLLRGFYREVTNAGDTSARLKWLLAGIIIIGGVVGGGVAIADKMTPSESELTPPSESFVAWEDNTFWKDERLSILTVTGVVSNTHTEWSIAKVEIEVEALGDADRVMQTYDVSVTPSTIRPGGEARYSKTLQLPIDCLSANTSLVWEWVSP